MCFFYWSAISGWLKFNSLMSILGEKSILVLVKFTKNNLHLYFGARPISGHSDGADLSGEPDT